jgi:hypothetical protein
VLAKVRGGEAILSSPCRVPAVKLCDLMFSGIFMCGLDSVHCGFARRDSARGFETMRLLISSASGLAGTHKERVSALVGGARKPLAVSMAGATDIARPAAVATMKRAVAPRTREVRERGGGGGGVGSEGLTRGVVVEGAVKTISVRER